MSTTFHSLRVQSVQPEAQDAVVVSFDVPPELRDEYGFEPGQHLTLRTAIDGQDVRRSYSICCAPDEGRLQVGVRRVQGGVFSNWLADHARPGLQIEVMPPQGRFFASVQPQQARHHLAVAGGSGITPILSIMKTVLAREPGSRFTLIYSNRSPASTMFKEDLEDLKNRYLSRVSLHYVFTQEHVESPLYAGRLDRARVARFMQTVVDPSDIAQAYICGPFQMNDEAEAALVAAGVPADRIHVERFGVAPAAGAVQARPVPQAGDARQARVVVVRDGLRREIDFREGQAHLLGCASAAGLDMPYSCTSGVCGTCRARLVEGRVRMDRNFALDKKEVEAGFILTCQAVPLTDTVVISFDDR
jgi:ring-1,2-phenylacetyl-CoA epoxidase subunit PaaE